MATKIILVCVGVRGMGIRRTTSISNTTNRIARRKKRIENGLRDLDRGSNPHSNGEDLLRYMVFRLLRVMLRIMIAPGIIAARKRANINVYILGLRVYLVGCFPMPLG